MEPPESEEMESAIMDLANSHRWVYRVLRDTRAPSLILHGSLVPGNSCSGQVASLAS